MKQRTVIAIGLDAADPELIETWMSQGYLENLKALRDRGAYGRLENIDHYKAETPWTTFLTGCMPQKTGYWSPIKFVEGTYEIEDIEAYSFGEYPPFYALNNRYRVAVFDPPQSRISDGVNGLQVLAWGAHSPQTPSLSRPAELLGELTERYGEHPAFNKDNGDWWDLSFLNRLYQSLMAGISQRVEICRELMQRERWNLFLTVFSETHSASHSFWYLSQPDHPLYQHRQGDLAAKDPLLDIFEATDRALGDILRDAPEDAHVVVFSVHGCDNNTADVPSMLCLPEFLYRFSFPGRMMLAPGQIQDEVPPLITSSKRKSWIVDIWQRRHLVNLVEKLLHKLLPVVLHRYLDVLFGLGQHQMISPRTLRKQNVPQYWQPAMWYKRLWPQMKAFALPSYSEGYVRINLQGREPSGIVPPGEYDALCEELTQHFKLLVNPRTGTSLVKTVRRTRQSAYDNAPNLPDADLVVEWHDLPADTIDHPEFGRMGPVPYNRTGSHRERGFAILSGPDILPGSALPAGRGVDLAPTILELMGAPIPDYFDGRSLVRVASLV